MAFQDSALPVVTTQDQTDEKFNSFDREGSTDFIPSAIPIDSILGFTPPALEVVPDNEVQADSLRQFEPESLESGFSNARELGKDTGENLQRSGDFASKVKRSHSDCFERVHGIFENDQVLSEGGINHCSVKRTLGRVSSSDSFFVWYIFLYPFYYIFVPPLIANSAFCLIIKLFQGLDSMGVFLKDNFVATRPL